MTNELRTVLMALEHNIGISMCYEPFQDPMVRELRLGLDWALRGIRFVPWGCPGYSSRALVPQCKEASDAHDHPYCLKVGRDVLAVVYEPYKERLPSDSLDTIKICAEAMGVTASINRKFGRWNPPYTVALTFTKTGVPWPDYIELSNPDVWAIKQRFLRLTQDLPGALFRLVMRERKNKLWTDARKQREVTP